MPASNGHTSHSHDQSFSDSTGSPRPSPWRKAVDTPSKQLLLELGRINLNYDLELHSRLDESALDRAREHDIALAASIKEHEYVRRNAERANALVQLEADAARRRDEAEQDKELEQQKERLVKEEIAEQQRKVAEAKKLAEAQRLAEAARAEAAAEVQRQRERQEAEDAARALANKQEEERQRRRVEEAAKEKAARDETAAGTSKSGAVPQPPAPPSSATAVNSQTRVPASSLAEREASHQKYLQIHQRLKEMRAYMVNERKRNPDLKTRMSEGRHLIKQCVGQLTQVAGQNKVPMQRLRALFVGAQKYRQPSMDVRPYILRQTGNVSDSEAQFPALLIYLLNIFSKAVINQFIDEASVTPAAADPTGIVAISMFAIPENHWQGFSLIDMLIAKFHVVCPVLWGIYGNEKTEGGRKRLGWWREAPGGPWVSEQRHGERMTGLGAGFAALSLRDFKNSKNANPFPHRNYWLAIACITNTPPQDRTATHFLVLRALIERSVPRFIGFYGQAAEVALRRALVDFPRDSPLKGAAAMGLSTVAELLKKDMHLTL